MPMRITCDAAAAEEAMRHRYERFEALTCHISQGIRDGIKAHNIHEQGHGFLPATPDDISKALAQAVAMILRFDEDVSGKLQHARTFHWYRRSNFAPPT
jgi:hypothetical protein